MDYTPILRADALDDELDDELDEEVDSVPVMGGIVRAGDGTDAVPTMLTRCETVLEPYENGEGGWSYRRVW